MQDSSLQNIVIPPIKLKPLHNYQLSYPELFQPKSNQQIIFHQPKIETTDLPSYNEIRRSNTHRMYEEEEDESQSDLGSQWANWNINRIKIFPSNHHEDTDQLFAHNRLRKRKSRSADKRVKSPSKLTIKNDKNQHSQMEKIERERRRLMMNRVLAGKGSFIWLFILGKNTTEQQLSLVQDIYKEYTDNDYVSPLCRSFDEARRFLKMQSCFFKIITDLEHSQAVLEESSLNGSIIAIYLYSNTKQKGAGNIFELKRKSRKIKGTFISIKQAVSQVSQDLSEQARFIQINQTLQRDSTFRFRFPGFFVLSGTDSSTVTQYRLCLYGAIKLTDHSQKHQLLNQFVEIIEMRYRNDQKQLANLNKYKEIDHISVNSQLKAAEIIKFYVKQSFYYAITNSLLRLARSSDEFRPCTIPFNEIYHAIRYYHSLEIGQRKSFKAYRGAKLRSREVSSLAIGSFIQLLGFTSSSLSKNEAIKFMDEDSYLIEIYVSQDEEGQKASENLYEHGYVEINKYGLAQQAFSNQQQVLFNALNVYQVVQIDLRSAVRTITLKYAALRYLHKKQKQKLTQQEAAVLENMQFCFKQYSNIEDDGDVLLLTQQHSKAKQYYTRLLRQNQLNVRVHAKLAEVEAELGNLQAAEHHALQMMQHIKQQQPLKVGDPHARMLQTIEKVTQILQFTENFVKYEQLVDFRLKTSSDCFQNSLALIERANTKMLRGELQGCLGDLVRADCLFEQKKNSFAKRIDQINRQYFFKSMCSCFNRELSAVLESQKQTLLLKNQQQQINFNANQSKIFELKIQIQKVKSEYMHKLGDLQKMEESEQNIRKYFKKVQEKDEEAQPIKAAKYYELQALSIKGSDFAQYQALMETAIDILKQHDPYHKQIGKLSESLADERYHHIKQVLESYQSRNNDKQKQSMKRPKKPFDYDKHKKEYKKCRFSYHQALDIRLYHKGKEHPQFIKTENKLAELNVEFSLLKQAESAALAITRRKVAGRHSEGAKSYLLLAKISLCRGQLKKSFRMIDSADRILNIALCPRNNKSFILKHPLYYEINLTKAKIFHRQLRHDLALRELILLQKLALKQPAAQELVASINEMISEIKLDQKEPLKFQMHILQAIQMRKRVQGKFNINSGMNFQKLAMFLKKTKQEKRSLSFHSLAIQIFSKFPADHPNAWIVHLANAIVFKNKKSPQSIAMQLQECLQIAEKRFSPDNISLAKIQIQVCKLLIQIGIDYRALGLYEAVDKNLQNQLKQSSKKESILLDSDDEKIALRKEVLKEMIVLYESVKGSHLAGIIGVQRCKSHLNYLSSSYIDERNESLKSLA